MTTGGQRGLLTAVSHADPVLEPKARTTRGAQRASGEADTLRLRRLLWLAFALGAVSVVVIARVLTPDPSGVGTHRQLGLPPCGFLWLTSLPCPACGLTTSFAYMSRFEVTRAVSAHPMGVPLFALCVVIVPISLRACLRASSFVDTMERLQAQRLAVLIAASLLLTWMARVVALVTG